MTEQSEARRPPTLLGDPSTWQQRYRRLLVVLDVVAIGLSVTMAQQLRFGDTYINWQYLEVSATIAVVWLAALAINQSRSRRIIGGGAEEYRRVWTATFGVFGTVAIVSMMLKLEIARGYLLIALPLGLVLLSAARWLARRALTRARQNGHCLTRVVAVGSVATVSELARSLSREPWSGYQVVGACVRDAPPGTHIDIPETGHTALFGDESHVVEAVQTTGSHAVAVVAGDGLASHDIREMSWQLEKLDVDMLVSPGVADVAGPRLQMRPAAGLPLIHLEKPQYQGAKRFQKRLFDVVFSGSVLLFGLPLLLTVALAVKLTTRGPVFYRQQRIGLNGTPFMMFKFRTMIDGADSLVGQLAEFNESTGGMLFKIRDDPRITPLGRFLRKYSLDELPQFLNVLKHDMSVVGPRPPLPSEVAAYDDREWRRLLVRPGITGLWQISGRSDLSWDDTVRLDLFYVENWSMMTDLVIAVKTARAVFNHTGAY